MFNGNKLWHAGCKRSVGTLAGNPVVVCEDCLVWASPAETWMTPDEKQRTKANIEFHKSATELWNKKGAQDA